MTTILSMVAARSLDHRGGLNLDSVSLESLRTQEGRESFLREFVVAMMPDRVNPALWLSWLQGGAPPFERGRLARVETGDERVSKALGRSSKRVARAVLGVQNADRAVDAAHAKRVAAERELTEARAFDAAVIEYAVSEHLVGIMGPMFAMGPAWTVMRALSGHVPATEMADELQFERDPAKRAKRETAFRAERQEETDVMLDALDLWAGDAGFERAVRDAVLGVAQSYKARVRRDAVRRTRASMKAAVGDGELVREKDQVVTGMTRFRR